jgi:hypothetical protein
MNRRGLFRSPLSRFLGGQFSYKGLWVIALYCEDLRYSYTKTFRRNSKVWSVQNMILSPFRSQFSTAL